MSLDLSHVSISYIGPTLVSDTGDNLYVEGTLADNGNIYAPPYAASKLLKIATATDTVSEITVPGSGYYAYSGAAAIDRKVYGVPNNSGTTLRFDIDTEASTTISHTSGGMWSWIGGEVAAGYVWGAPADATSFYRLDPTAGSVSLTGSVASGSDKWSRFIRAGNGNIYAPPRSASTILVVDPTTGATTTIARPAGVGWYSSGTVSGNFLNSTLYIMSRGGASLFGDGRMAGLAVFAGEISDADAATLAAAV